MIELMQRERMAEVHIMRDPHTALTAIVALHNTQRGPALGGCRFYPYPNFESAIDDACRLARGMAYKAAMADLPLGGGKAVIIQDDNNLDRQQCFEIFGRFLHNLGGRYISAVDVGTTPADMDVIATQTPYVTSTTVQGDPSPWTADGVVMGIQAAVEHRLLQSSLRGLTVAIQGLGNVGWEVARNLHFQGVTLIVADLDDKRLSKAVKQFSATVVDVKEIHAQPCDIFCPCAMGAILNESSIPELNCSIVAGSANNQLAKIDCAAKLKARDILYAPDYIINAGGLIYLGLQQQGYAIQQIQLKNQGIANNLRQVFDESASRGKSTALVADQIAEMRLQEKPVNELNPA